MLSIAELIADEAKRKELIVAVLQLIESQVNAKAGLGGMALKAAYQAIQGLKPGFMNSTVQNLLPDFARVLDPMREQAQATGSGLGAYFAEHAPQVAQALLQITDAKAQASSNAAVKSLYGKMRGTAEKNVAGAAKGLGEVLEAFLG